MYNVCMIVHVDVVVIYWQYTAPANEMLTVKSEGP